MISAGPHKAVEWPMITAWFGLDGQLWRAIPNHLIAAAAGARAVPPCYPK